MIAHPLLTERWTTGTKLLVILSVALLPLVLIATFATLRITQIADTELRSRLRVAANESSRAVSIELSGDITAARAVLDMLSSRGVNAPHCARLDGVLAQQVRAGVRFAVLDRRGRIVCGETFPLAAGLARSDWRSSVQAIVVADSGIVLHISNRGRTFAAVLFFPRPFLAALARPSGFSPDYGAFLAGDGSRLDLDTLERHGALERRESTRIRIGLDDLVFGMTVRSAPIGSPLLLSLLLPLLMWILAALISWFVVDRLLIAPLRQLRSSIAAYTPGDHPDTAMLRALPAQEIRELGDTFRALSRTVAIHEAELAEGLVRQTKLTREVHHRVKNNLQVISSLINFHARGARSAEATQAYASIQRRVDALAAVHRYHYAELEENRGLSLRAVLGELASNIRATAPAGTRIGIVLDTDPIYVTQDVAVAVAFLVTELIELATSCDAQAQLRVSLKPVEGQMLANLRVSSRALVDDDALQDLLRHRYGRVMEGLTRQLRSTLQHDPLTGVYEISIAATAFD